MNELITKKLNTSSIEKFIAANELTDRLVLQQEILRMARNNHQAMTAIYPHSFLNVDPYERHSNHQLTEVAS